MTYSESVLEYFLFVDMLTSFRKAPFFIVILNNGHIYYFCKSLIFDILLFSFIKAYVFE